MHPRVPVVVLATALSMTIAEFVEFQKLSPDDLRARFRLPATCDPSVTASTPAGVQNYVVVGVECRVDPNQAPPERAGQPARRTPPRGS